MMLMKITASLNCGIFNVKLVLQFPWIHTVMWLCHFPLVQWLCFLSQYPLKAYQRPISQRPFWEGCSLADHEWWQCAISKMSLSDKLQTFRFVKSHWVRAHAGVNASMAFVFVFLWVNHAKNLRKSNPSHFCKLQLIHSPGTLLETAN